MSENKLKQHHYTWNPISQEKQDDIYKMISIGITDVAVAKELSINVNTVRRYKIKFNLN